MQAHLAIARGALDEAEQLSRTAARIISDHPQLLAVNATIALRRGQVDQALAMLSQAVELLPEEPAVLFSLGFAYLQKATYCIRRARLPTRYRTEPSRHPSPRTDRPTCTTPRQTR